MHPGAGLLWLLQYHYYQAGVGNAVGDLSLSVSVFVSQYLEEACLYLRPTFLNEALA